MTTAARFIVNQEDGKDIARNKKEEMSLPKAWICLNLEILLSVQKCYSIENEIKK